MASGYNEPWMRQVSILDRLIVDNGELVDFVVCTNCFKQNDLFLSFEISHKFKYDAIFEVDCISPRTCQIPFQFVSMKRWMKCIGSEQFSAHVQSNKSVIRSSNVPRLASPLLNAPLPS